MATSEQSGPRGIFEKDAQVKDGANKTDNRPSQEKEVFKDPFAKQAEVISERSKRKPVNIEALIGDDTLEKTAAAVNSGGPTRNVQADLDEMDKFSEKDLELAEQIIFRGYAEFDAVMPNFPKYKFTICSTSAEEIAIVDEIVFETIKKSEDSEGNVNLSQNNVRGLRNSLFLAISYRGRDEKELMPDSSCHLNTIKKAVIRVTELENLGNLDESVKLKDSLKNKIVKRSSAIRRMATPMIDFLSDKKYEFDSKMLTLISSPGILPKF